MKRIQKYPNTKYFTYYNANPKERIGGDCVVRAISLAADISWIETVLDLTSLGITIGFILNDPHTYTKYLTEQGWLKMPEPRDIRNKKLTVAQAIDQNLFPNGLAIAVVGSHHLVAIKDNKVHDIWDSSKCILHTYFVIPNRA